MSVQPAIETVIGLALIFYLLALLASGVVEASANVLNKRAKYLLRGLDQLLNPGKAGVNVPHGLKSWFSRLFSDKMLTALVPWFIGSLREGAIYRRARAGKKVGGGQATGTATAAGLVNHPLVLPLWQARPSGDRLRLPSYVPAATLATAMIDVLDVKGRPTVRAVRSAISSAPIKGELKSALIALLPAGNSAAVITNGVAEALRAELEKWIDAQMERVTGAYKRWAKRFAAFIAIPVAFFWHIDALALTTTLWTNESVRAAAVAAASNPSLCVAASPSPSASPTSGTGTDSSTPDADCVKGQLAALKDAGLPIGPHLWQPENRPKDGVGWALLFVGLLISGVAGTMGAPFWFDVMNRFISVRNAGVKPAST